MKIFSAYRINIKENRLVFLNIEKTNVNSEEPNPGNSQPSVPVNGKNLLQLGENSLQKVATCNETHNEKITQEPASARDQEGTSYNIYLINGKKVFYQAAGSGLLYKRSGDCIGFTAHGQFHFHKPDMPEAEKNVGTIANSYEGQGRIPDYSRYESP